MTSEGGCIALFLSLPCTLYETSHGLLCLCKANYTTVLSPIFMDSQVPRIDRLLAVRLYRSLLNASSSFVSGAKPIKTPSPDASVLPHVQVQMSQGLTYSVHHIA